MGSGARTALNTAFGGIGESEEMAAEGMAFQVQVVEGKKQCREVSVKMNKNETIQINFMIQKVKDPDASSSLVPVLLQVHFFLSFFH